MSETWQTLSLTGAHSLCACGHTIRQLSSYFFPFRNMYSCLFFQIDPKTNDQKGQKIYWKFKSKRRSPALIQLTTDSPRATRIDSVCLASGISIAVRWDLSSWEFLNFGYLWKNVDNDWKITGNSWRWLLSHPEGVQGTFVVTTTGCDRTWWRQSRCLWKRQGEEGGKQKRKDATFRMDRLGNYTRKG